jgi:transcriptional regulator with XRE-family HTH domain
MENESIKSIELRRLLSANIKARRAVLDISQEKLAELMNISSQMINCIEGCRTWVSDKTLVKLAEVLKVEVFQLIIPVDILLVNKSLLSSVHLSNLKQSIKNDVDIRFDLFAKTGTGIRHLD